MERCPKALRYEASETSVNAIFAMTGPSAGVLHIRPEFAVSHDGTLNDSEVLTLTSCFDFVAVPADQYWRAASQHRSLLFPFRCTGAAAVAPHDALSSSGDSFLLTSAAIKRPDPINIPRSFYITRLDAISSRHYATDSGAIVVAVDSRNGTGGKMFNTLLRQELISFVEAIPLYQHRNLYVVIDESAAVDPFFDIDLPMDLYLTGLGEEKKKLLLKGGAENCGSFSSSPAPCSFLRTVTAVVERWLGQMLHFLRDKVEAATGAKLKHCLLLTSSVLVRDGNIMNRHSGSGRGEKETEHMIGFTDSKISFHIHFRMDSNAVFANVKELHHFMLRVREELDVSLSRSADPDTVALHRMLRSSIDFGVYTRWRAFRLPYNVKLPLSNGVCQTDVVAPDLVMTALSKSSLASVTIPDVGVGAAASSVVHLIDLFPLQELDSSSHQQQQCRMITKLFFMFRFLLPVIPGMTSVVDKDLVEFLSAYTPYVFSDAVGINEKRHEVANAVFDLALIQREKRSTLRDKNEPVLLRLIAVESAATVQGTEAVSSDPFFVPRPPHRDGVRVPVFDKQIKNLVAEVFRCLCTSYSGEGDGSADLQSRVLSMPITGDCVSVQYQDSIRAYYVQQKRSKYCLNQRREHRGTYPQLYLTYGSIKLRCYSNDCCSRCLAVRWSANDDEKMAGRTAILLPVDSRGYPKYERLAHIRQLLFPPLPPEELLRRYGIAAIERLHQ